MYIETMSKFQKNHNFYNRIHLPRFYNIYLYGTVSDTARRLCSLQRTRHPLQPFPIRPPFNNGLLSYLSQHEKWVSVRMVPFYLCIKERGTNKIKS